MKMRAFLPAAGWTALAFAACGAGAAIAYVTEIDGKPPTDQRVQMPSPGNQAGGYCMVAALAGQSLAPEAAKAYEEAEPPLWTDLGSVTFPVRPRTPKPKAISTRACGSPPISTTPRPAARCARRNDSIPTARCASRPRR